MDKIEQLYNLYISKGIITDKTSLDSFKNADEKQISSLYDLGVKNEVFQKTDLNQFQSAWSVKKKDNTISVSDVGESATPQIQITPTSESILQVGNSDSQESKSQFNYDNFLEDIENNLPNTTQTQQVIVEENINAINKLYEFEDKNKQAIEEAEIRSNRSVNYLEGESEEIKTAFNAFSEIDSLSENELNDIDNQILKEQKGDFGTLSNWWNNTKDVFGFDDTRKVSKREDLVNELKRKKRIDFLNEIDNPELRRKLGEIKIKQNFRRNLEIKDSEILIQKKALTINALVEKIQRLENNQQSITTALGKEKDKKIQKSLIEEGRANELKYNEFVSEINSLRKDAETQISSIENNQQSIGTFQDEINLLKRNYQWLDNQKNTLRLGFGEVANSINFQYENWLNGLVNGENITQNQTKEFDENRKKILKDALEFKKEANRQREFIEPKIEVKNINSVGDFAQFMVDSTIENVPTLTQFSLGGVGIASFALSQQASGELDIRQGIADDKNKLKEIDKILTDKDLIAELGKDELSKMRKEKQNILGKRKLTDLDIKLTSSAFAGAEIALGYLGKIRLINKGKRVVRSVGTKELRTRTSQSILNSLGKETWDLVKDVTGEGLEELGTGTFQNAIEIGYFNDQLDDEGNQRGVFDDGVENFVGGVAVGTNLSGSTKVLGNTLGYISDRKRRNQVGRNTLEAIGYLKDLDNLDLPESSRNALLEKANSLFEENKEIIKSTEEQWKQLSDSDKSKIRSINNEIQSINITLQDKKSKNKNTNNLLKSRLNQLEQSKEEIIYPENENKKDTKSTLQESTKSFAEKLGNQEDISRFIKGATKVKLGDSEIILKNDTTDDSIILESISTNKSGRGNGSARNAIEKLVDLADQNSKKLSLVVVPLNDTTNPNKLVEFYKSVGFVKEEGFELDGGKMIREPKKQSKTNDTISVSKTIDSETETEEINFDSIDTTISEKTKPLEIQTNINDYTVKVEDGNLKILPKFGNKTPSRVEVKKIEEQYIEQTNFDSGQSVNFEGVENISQEQVSEKIATDSSNAIEIASEIIQVQNRDLDLEKSLEVSKNDAIADTLSKAKVNDSNNDLTDLNPSYKRGRGKTKSLTLDEISLDASSNIGQEISINDVIEFLSNNESVTEYRNTSRNISGNNIVNDLKQKFQQVTGLKPTPSNIEKISNKKVKSEQETETDQNSEDREVPFQTESTQIRIQEKALTSLVDRLKKTGLAKSVEILSDSKITDFLKNIGVNNVLSQTDFNFKEISQTEVSSDTLNSVRTSLRRSYPNSQTLQILDAIQKDNIDSLESFELQEFAEYVLDNGLTFQNLSNMLIQDDIVVSTKNAITKILNIGEKGRNIENYIRFQKELSDNGVTETPNGFVYNGVVYLNKDKVKKDTPIHEFGHLWNSYIKDNNPEVYRKGLELIKDSEYHIEVKNNDAYKHLSEEGKLEEALAQAIGEKGVKILNESRKTNFNAWFKNLFTRIAKGLGLRNINSKQLSGINLDKFTDLASAEILSGQRLVDNSKNKSRNNKLEESKTKNIDVIIAEQKAILETRNKLKDLFRERKDFRTSIKKELIKYIKQKLDSKRYNEKTKGEFNKILTLVRSDKTTKKSLLKAMQKVDDISLDIDNRILEKGIKKQLKANRSNIQSGKEVANSISQEAKDKLDLFDTLIEYSTSKSKSEKNRNILDKIDSINNDILSITHVESDIDGLNQLVAKENLNDSEIESLEILQLAKQFLQSQSIDNASSKNILLSNVLSNLKEIRNNGRTELLSEKSKIENEIEAEQEVLLSDIDSKNASESNDFKKPFKQLEAELSNKIPIKKKLVQFYKRIYLNPVFRNLITIGETLSKKKQKGTKIQGIRRLLSDVDFAEIEMNDIQGKWVDEINDIKNSIFGSILVSRKVNLVDGKLKIDKSKVGKTKKADFILSSTQEIELNYEGFSEKNKFSNSTLLDVWMKSKDESNLEGLAKGGFDSKTIAEIDSKLTDDLKNYGTELMNWYREKYNFINSVYRKMFYRNLPFNEFYSGKLNVGGVSDLDQNLFNTIQSFGSVNPNSIKKRTSHKNPILPTSTDSSVFDYINQMSRFIAYADVNRRLNRTLKNEDFRKTVIINNGSEGSAILDFISAFQKRHIEKVNRPTSSKVINFINKNIVVSRLGGKIKNIPIQMISFVNGQLSLPDDLSVGEWATIHRDFIKDGVFLFENSKLLQQRRNTKTASKAFSSVDDSYSGNPTMTSNDRMNMILNSGREIIDSAQALGMTPIQVGDFIGVLGSVPVFSSAKKRISEENPDFSEKEIVDEAMKVFESAVNRTQQGQTKGSKSFVQNDPYLRLLVNFGTTVILNLNETSIAFKDLKRAGKQFLSRNKKSKSIAKKIGLEFDGAEPNNTVRSNIKSIINYGFAQNIMYTLYNASIAGGGYAVTKEAVELVVALFSDEEDEKELKDFSGESKDLVRTMLTGQLLDAPLVGNSLKFFFDQKITQKEFTFGSFTSVVLLDEIDKLESSIELANNAKKEGTKIKHLNKAYAKFATIFIGLPPEHTTELIQYIDLVSNPEIFSEEERNLIYQGFSFSQINFRREERTGVKLSDLLSQKNGDKKELKKSEF